MRVASSVIQPRKEDVKGDFKEVLENRFLIKLLLKLSTNTDEIKIIGSSCLPPRV